MSSNNTTTGITRQPPGPPFPWYWAIRGVLCFLTVSGNGVIIYLILTRRRLQNTTNWLTLSLAVADFLIGAVVISSCVCFFSVPCEWKAINLIFRFVFFVSISNLCALTLDRYVAVIYPFKYFLLKRNKMRLALVSSTWLIPTIFALIPLFWENSPRDTQILAWQVHQAVETVTLIVLPCALMLIAYGRIWHSIYRQARVIESHDNEIRREVKTSTRVGREGRSSLRVYGLLVVLFVVCWSLSGYRYVCGAFFPRLINEVVLACSRLLMLANSAVNFIVYAFFKRDIQMELVRSLQKMAFWNGNQIEERSCDNPGPAESTTERLH